MRKLKQLLKNNPYALHTVNQLRALMTKNHEYIKHRIKQKILNYKAANQLISEILSSKKPACIGKIGSCELDIISQFDNPNHYTATRDLEYIHHGIFRIAGLYPETQQMIDQFSKIYLNTLPHCDILGIWYKRNEANIIQKYASPSALIPMPALEPYFHQSPWSQYLENKKILVVHPFTDTIKLQYQKRQHLWPNLNNVLPNFQLLTIKTPLHHHLTTPQDSDWITALNRLKNEMTATDFDIALIGCGAWSLPLTAHAKQLGKVGIHLGGATQVLFGIMGSRWENNTKFKSFMNSYWCRPSQHETPSQVGTVEQAAYW